MMRAINPAMKEILDHKVRIKYLDECFAKSTLDIKLEIQNCKTLFVLMDVQILDGNPLLTMSLSLTKLSSLNQ